MKIGNIELPKYAALAPLAGVGDRAMREISREFGAVWTVGEMTSSKGLSYGSKKSAELLEINEAERPCAVQLFGSEPEVMAEAARMSLEYKPDAIDINFGCPVPKVAGNGRGSALMKDPELAGRIVRAVVDAVDIPVTVKFRAGWDNEHLNAVEFACICEANGASALTVHGRTRTQMYAPPVNWDIIRQVKEAVSVPVIGNGDVLDAASAKALVEQTGCDGIMIGRGAQGNPWIFSQILYEQETGVPAKRPELNEVVEMILRHTRMQIDFKGEYTGIREMRKHASWYMSGYKNSSRLRGRINEVESLDQIIELFHEVLSY